jgi:hypothetical protein
MKRLIFLFVVLICKSLDAAPFVFTFDTPGNCTQGSCSSSSPYPNISVVYAQWMSSGGDPGGYAGYSGSLDIDQNLDYEFGGIGTAFPGGLLLGPSDYGFTVSFNYYVDIEGPPGSFQAPELDLTLESWLCARIRQDSHF